MPEMKNPKHPSPHMINIPWWDYQHVWFVSTACPDTEHSAEQLLPRHQSLGLTQPEEQQLQSSSKKQMSVRVQECRQHKPCDPPDSSKVLSRDQGAGKVPASARLLKGLEQQHLAWDTSPAPPSPPSLSAVPSPHPSTGQCGVPLLLPPSVAISSALLWRDVWNSNLWQHWGHEAVEMHPLGTMPGSFLGIFKSRMLNSVLEEFAN